MTRGKEAWLLELEAAFECVSEREAQEAELRLLMQNNERDTLEDLTLNARLRRVEAELAAARRYRDDLVVIASRLDQSVSGRT